MTLEITDVMKELIRDRNTIMAFSCPQKKQHGLLFVNKLIADAVADQLNNNKESKE